MRFILIIFLCTSIANPVFSQASFSIGTTAGYGIIYIGEDNDFKNFFTQQTGSQVSLSFIAAYKPAKPIFNINSGLALQTIIFDKSTLHFLKFPLGFGFHPEKKNNVIFGFSFYGQYVVFKTGNYISNNSINQFHFGITPYIGYSFVFNNNYSFFFRIQRDIPFTPLETYNTHSPGGMAYSIKEYSFDRSLCIGMKYMLNTKKRQD